MKNRHPILDLVTVTGATIDLAGVNLTPGQARALAARLRLAANDATGNATKAQTKAEETRELEATDRAHPAVIIAAETAGVLVSDLLKLRGPRHACKVAQLVAWSMVTFEGAPASTAAHVLGRSRRQAEWMVQRWPAVRRANPELADLERRYVHALNRYLQNEDAQLWLPV